MEEVESRIEELQSEGFFYLFGLGNPSQAKRMETLVEAKKRFEEILKIQKTHSLSYGSTLCYLGDVDLESGKVAEGFKKYDEAIRLYPRDPEVLDKHAEAKEKYAAQKNKKSPVPSTPLSVSPTTSGSPNSSADLSGSPSSGEFVVGPTLQAKVAGGETPLEERALLIAEYWALIQQGIIIKGDHIKTIRGQRDAVLAEIGEIEKSLRIAGIVTVNDYEKLSNFQKDRKIKGPNGIKATKRSLREREEKLLESVKAYDKELDIENQEFDKMYDIYSSCEELNRQDVAAIPETKIQKLRFAIEQFRANIIAIGAEDKVLLPTLTATSVTQQPKPPALPPKKSVPVAAGVDYSWMHQQAAAPRPAQAQQPQSVSQLLNNAYGRK